MAHNMEILNGQVSFARAEGEPLPWWANSDGLGEGQTFRIDATWEELLSLANLNHTVEMVKLETPGVTSEQQSFYRPVRRFHGGRHDGMREAFGKPFTGTYENVQVNATDEGINSMTGIADAVLAVGGGQATKATAGAIRNGNRAFICLKVAVTTIEVNGYKDTTVLYISILNSWDGSSPLAIVNSAVRTVCDNTFSYNLATAMREAKMKAPNGEFVKGRPMVIRHQGDVTNRIEIATAALMQELSWGEAYSTYMQRLAEQRFTDAQFERMMVDLLKPKDTTEAHLMASYDRRSAVLLSEWRREVNDRGGMTAWGALNAYTYLTNHFSTAKGSELNAGVKMESRLFGDTKTAQDGKALIGKVTSYLNEKVLATV